MLIANSLLSMAANLFITTVGIFGIGFLIGFHELGHFLFCKLFRVRTPSFSIGFGPKIFSKKIGTTEFILAPIPLGGYVEIAGAAEVGQGEQKEAHAEDKYSFAQKPYYQKLLIMLGGILFNLFFAYFAVFLILFLGTPKTPMLYPFNATTQIESLQPDSKQTSLQPGDTILAINETSVDNAKEVLRSVRNLATDTAQLTLMRNNQKQTLEVPIFQKETPFGTVRSLDALFVMEPLKLDVVSAVSKSITITNYYIKMIFFSFANMFRAKNLKGLGGPLAVVGQTIKGAQSGFKIFLLLLAIISINLAILNLIPLPILDGGQILFYTIEAIIRRPLPVKVKEYIHIGSWLFILGLIILLSIRDASNMLKPVFDQMRSLIGK